MSEAQIDLLKAAARKRLCATCGLEINGPSVFSAIQVENYHQGAAGIAGPRERSPSNSGAQRATR